MCVSHGRCTAEPISWPNGHFTPGLSWRLRERVGNSCVLLCMGTANAQQGETTPSYMLFRRQMYLVCISVSTHLARLLVQPFVSLRSRVARPPSCAGGRCIRALANLPRAAARVASLWLAGCPSSTATPHRLDHTPEHCCSASHLTPCRPQSTLPSLRPSWAW